MIDDKILVSNKLLPNTAQRLNVGSSFGDSLVAIDARAGSVVWAEVRVDIPVPKSEVVYLAPGTHMIDVGVRTNQRAIFLAGELRVELVELLSNTNINIPLLY